MTTPSPWAMEKAKAIVRGITVFYDDPHATPLTLLNGVAIALDDARREAVKQCLELLSECVSSKFKEAFTKALLETT